MHSMPACKYIFPLLFLWSHAILSAQKTTVSGRVVDSESLEPIPFVNIGFLHSPVGTISEMDGSFYLSSSEVGDTLLFSSIGYETYRVLIRKGVSQELNIMMVPVSILLEEIIVTPGENPAFRILEKINDNKKRNNPDRFSSYQYKAYTKLRLDLNNVDKAFRDQPLLRDFGFIFDYMDSSEVFNKNYLPLMISESVSKFYYSKNPPVRREVMEAFKVSGIENSTVSQFTGKMYQQLNIYDNFITFFDPGFVSPISDIGRLYYRYYLEDSSWIDNSWCYKISFRPKRTQERTFYGYFWVADTSFAIQKFQLRVSADVNLNLVKDMIAINEFKKLNDTTWFLASEDLVIDFNVAEKSYGFFGRKTAFYDSILIESPLPEAVTRMTTNTYLLEDRLDRDEHYWDLHRKGVLTQEDRNTYLMVDSVKLVPRYKTLYGLANMLASYYWVAGPVELGPYYTFISGNAVEGTRLRLGGRTSNRFSTKLMLGGHIAYGFEDRQLKYGLYYNYMFGTNPRISTGASWYHDIRQLGKSENAFLDDNFMASLLRRQPNHKLSLVDQLNVFFEREWVQGFSNTLTFRHQTIHSTSHVPFITLSSGGDSVFHASLTSAELVLNTHFAYREKFLLGKFERLSLGSEYPSVDFGITFGIRGLLNSDYEYLKLSLAVSDKIEVNPAGHLKYRFTAGKIYGNLPYPLLKLHEGNETYAYDPQAFNMMNYYEFVSDAYVHLFAEHHFQGFFLNRVPLIRNLHLREVVGCNMLFGSLRGSNETVMLFPEGLYKLTEPYYEVSAGLENIFKLIRIEAMWRLSYLDHEGIRPFGVRVGLQFSF